MMIEPPMIEAPKIEPPWQWQVVRVRLDPVEGSEQAGERPALIVSREPLNAALRVVAVLPCTRRKAGRRIHSTEVALEAGTAGLPADSLVMAQQIRIVSKSRVLRSYGRLDDEALRASVQEAIRAYLDLDSGTLDSAVASDRDS
jgi:mRNA interferase MazF